MVTFRSNLLYSSVKRSYSLCKLSDWDFMASLSFRSRSNSEFSSFNLVFSSPIFNQTLISNSVKHLKESVKLPISGLQRYRWISHLRFPYLSVVITMFVLLLMHFEPAELNIFIENYVAKKVLFCSVYLSHWGFGLCEKSCLSWN